MNSRRDAHELGLAAVGRLPRWPPWPARSARLEAHGSVGRPPKTPRTFSTMVNETLLKLGIAGCQAGWVAQNFITDDTEALDARGDPAGLADAAAKFAKEATRFDKIAASRRSAASARSAEGVAGARHAGRSQGGRGSSRSSIRRMRATYGKGKWCPDPAKPDQCHNIDEVTRVLASSRNEAELRAEWEGWHTISPPMKKDYARFAELSNKGAKELGFADTGAMWRAKIRHAARRLRQGDWIGCGIRSGRSISSCTPTCA